MGYSQSTPFTATQDRGLTFQSTLSNPFPTGMNQPTGTSLGAATGIGTSLVGALYDVNRGYSQQWNFTVQHQPWQNWLIEVAYVGNHGVHLFMYNQNLNWLPDQTFNSLGSSWFSSYSSV